MSSSAGIAVPTECVEAFNELKLGKKIKYVIYKISDDQKSFEVDAKSDDPDWASFAEHMTTATSKDRRGKPVENAPRIGIYDLEYELPNGEGTRNKIVSITHNRDDGPVFLKFIYGNAWSSMANSLPGVAVHLSFPVADDIKRKSEVLNAVDKRLKDED
jgi:cofilin